MTSRDYAFTGSKDALCIQPSVLELSVNAKMCDPCTSCRMVIYIDTADDRNYNRFSMNFLCHSGRILHRHSKPLSM